MTKRSPIKWLKENHPAIYAEYLEVIKKARREKAREYQRQLRERANAKT